MHRKLGWLRTGSPHVDRSAWHAGRLLMGTCLLVSSVVVNSFDMTSLQLQQTLAVGLMGVSALLLAWTVCVLCRRTGKPDIPDNEVHVHRRALACHHDLTRSLVVSDRCRPRTAAFRLQTAPCDDQFSVQALSREPTERAPTGCGQAPARPMK